MASYPDTCHVTLIVTALAVLSLDVAGCRPREDADHSASVPPASADANDSTLSDEPAPRFAKNSPFTGDYKLAVQSEGKRLWAKPFLWEKAPEFAVEKWLTPEPDMQGKYVLIEYWATWCGPCRRSIPLLNEIHRRFGDRLTVIGISDEPEEKVRALQEPKIEYHVAVDTRARMKTALAVTGIPHVIILEPQGYVVWEGFPLLKGQELSLDVVERILNVNSQNRPASEP